MKKLSELAIVCAKRPDVLLQLYEGFVCVYVGVGPERGSMVAKWDDDMAIAGFIQQLETGKFAEEQSIAGNMRIIGKAA